MRSYSEPTFSNRSIVDLLTSAILDLQNSYRVDFTEMITDNFSEDVLTGSSTTSEATDDDDDESTSELFDGTQSLIILLAPLCWFLVFMALTHRPWKKAAGTEAAGERKEDALSTQPKDDPAMILLERIEEKLDALALAGSNRSNGSSRTGSSTNTGTKRSNSSSKLAVAKSGSGARSGSQSRSPSREPKSGVLL